ncbi:LapA family protein [Bacillus alveayuensis]|jgi:lipopolysaccharide assembly protein A|uniref:LapA family protein n=1 Tax=Aeribacillus alveayuensis TaxID=279215 RepID=UPI0005D0FC9F|nr:lipopolysaccharide assembly protein LapA domain-containing protein [Bacillus alveayuensis]
MKKQWALILALLLMLIVSIFAVINGDPVEVHYLFGTARWPLVLVIMGAAFMGAVTIMAFGIFRFLSLQRELKKLQKENQSLKSKLHQFEEKPPIKDEQMNFPSS